MRPAHLLLLTLLASRAAEACQCGLRPGPLEALPQSTAVFDGTVVRRTPLHATVEGFHYVLERNEFLVHQAWRGSNEDRLVIVTGFSNCDFLFDVGSRYLVFARPSQRPDLGLGSSICLPTQRYHRSGPALAALGPSLSFHPPEFVAPESFLARIHRIARSSFLLGALSVAGILDSRFPFAYDLGLVHFISPLTTLVALGAVVFLALRRRFRFLVFLSPLLLMAVLLSLTLQGLAFIYSDPTLSYWVLERTRGA